MHFSSARPARRVLLLAGLALLAGGARAATTVIDPDAAVDGQDISTFFAAQGVTLSHTPDQAAADDSVYANASSIAGSNVFGWNELTFAPQGNPPIVPPLGADDHWARSISPDFIADLNFQVQSASILVQTDFGATLTAFDTTNTAIGSTTIGGDNSAFQTLAFTASGNDISRVVVSLNKAPGADFGLLDHLVLTTQSTQPVPEPGSLALLAVGGLPLAGLLRRRVRGARRA
jgi:hypothetical protein